MNEEPQPAPRKSATRDGLAALAIVVLAIALIALVISKLV